MAETAAPPEAVKIYRILAKRPTSPQLFDRFFHSWLEHANVAGLQAFLQAQDEEAGATWVIRAAVLEELGQDREAISALREARKRDPNAPEILLRLARIYTRTQRLKEANFILVAAQKLEAGPDLTLRMAHLRGQVLLRLGQTREALKIWRALIDANPEDDELREDVVEWLAEERLWTGAIEISGELIRRTGDAHLRVNRQFRLAELYAESGGEKQALKLYGQLLRDSGQGTWLEAETLDRVEALLRHEPGFGDFGAFLTKMREANPKRIAVRQSLARWLAAQGKKDEAVAEFEEILRLTPGAREIREQFVTVLSELGEHKRAVAELERLVGLFPQDAELLVLLTQAYGRAGRDEDAVETVRRFLEAGEAAEHRYVRAIRLLDDFSLSEPARELTRKFLAAFPDSVSAKEAAAALFQQRFQRKEALALWQDLLRTGDRDVLLRVAKTVLRRGHYEVAFDHLHRRRAEFAQDFPLLETYLRAALSSGAVELAKPQLRPWVNGCRSPVELENATRFALSFARVGQMTEGLSEELLADPEATVQDACLSAVLLEELSRGEDAEALLRKFAETGNRPDSTLLALTQLSALQQHRRDFSGAIETAERLIEAPGGNKTTSLQKLVQLHRKAGNLREALAWTRRLKARLPSNPQNWMDEGLLLHEMDQTADAIALFRQATGRFEGDERFPARLAKWFAAEGQWTDAEQLYWRLYEQAEGDADKLTWARRLYATAKEQSQDRVDALLERMRQRQEQDRSSVAPLLILADFFRREERPDEESAALKRAAQLQPRNVEVLLQLARMHEGKGEWRQAVDALERAMPHDRSGRAQRRIPRVLTEAGQADLALEKLVELAQGGKIEAEEAREVAGKLIRHVTIPQAARFLNLIADHAPDDFRQQYLTAVFREECGDFAGAAEAFRVLLGPPNFSRPIADFGPNSRAVARLAPRETQQLAHWWKDRAEAYAYRPDAPHGTLFHASFAIHNHGSQRNVGGPVLWLPDSAEQGRIWAIEHLSGILTRADAATREVIRRDLAAAGISPLQIRVMEAVHRGDAFPEVLVANADQPAAAAMWAMFDAKFGNNADPAETGRVLASLKSRHPVLALAARVSVRSALSGESKIDAQEVLETMHQLASGDLLAFDELIAPVCHTLMRQGHEIAAAEILDRSMEVAGEIWKLGPAPDFDFGILNYAIPGIAPGVDRFLTFPAPVRIVQSTFSSTGGWDIDGTSLTTIERAKTRRLVENLDHPGLKFAVERSAEIPTARGRLKECAERGDVASQVLVAIHQGGETGARNLLGLLENASPTERERLYELLLLRLAEVELDVIPPQHHGPLRLAAKRIMGGNVAPGGAHLALNRAMSRLGGLAPELAKLRNSAAAVRIGGGSIRLGGRVILSGRGHVINYPFIYPGASNQQVTELQELRVKIDQLTAEERYADAAWLVQKSVSTECLAALADVSERWQTQALDFLRQAHPRVREELRALLDPGPKADFHARARFGAFLAMFGNDPDAAAAVFEEILRENPQNDALRLRLIELRLDAAEIGEALAQAAALHPQSHHHLGRILVRPLTGNGNGNVFVNPGGVRQIGQILEKVDAAAEFVEEVLGAAEFAAGWLPRFDDGQLQRGDYAWAAQIWGWLWKQPLNAPGGKKLGALFGELNWVGDPELSEWHRQRLVWFEKLGRQLMRMPSHRADALRVWISWQDLAGSEMAAEAEVFGYLKEALLPAGPGPILEDNWPFSPPGAVIVNGRNSLFIRGNGSIGAGVLGLEPQTTDAPLKNVLEAAGRAAFRANRPDWLAFEVLPKMRENWGQDAPNFAYAKLLQTLYFGEKDEIVPAIEAARKILDRSESPFDPQRVWAHIVEIANEVRKLGVDFSKIPKFKATNDSDITIGF